MQFDKAPCNNTIYLIDISGIINIYISHHYFHIYFFSIHIPGCNAYIIAYYIILLIDQYKLHTRRECISHAIYIHEYIYNVFYIKKSTLFLAHIILVLICSTCILIAISEMKLSAYWTIYTRYALLYMIQLMHGIAHCVIMTSLRFTIIYIGALVIYITTTSTNLWSKLAIISYGLFVSSKTTIHVHMSVCKQIKNRYIECKLFYEQRVILPYYNANLICRFFFLKVYLNPLFILKYCMHLNCSESYMSVNGFVYKWIQIYVCNIYRVTVDIYIQYVSHACVHVKCVCVKHHVGVNHMYVYVINIIDLGIRKYISETYNSKNMTSSAKRFFTSNHLSIIYTDQIFLLISSQIYLSSSNFLYALNYYFDICTKIKISFHTKFYNYNTVCFYITYTPTFSALNEKLLDCMNHLEIVYLSSDSKPGDDLNFLILYMSTEVIISILNSVLMYMYVTILISKGCLCVYGRVEHESKGNQYSPLQLLIVHSFAVCISLSFLLHSTHNNDSLYSNEIESLFYFMKDNYSICSLVLYLISDFLFGATLKNRHSNNKCNVIIDMIF